MKITIYKKKANQSQLSYIKNMTFIVKKLHMFKTLYESYLMNVGIKKSPRTIMRSSLPYFRFKNINSFETL